MKFIRFHFIVFSAYNHACPDNETWRYLRVIYSTRTDSGDDGDDDDNDNVDDDDDDDDDDCII